MNQEDNKFYKTAPVEILKTFNGIAPEDLKKSDTKFLIDWEKLIPAINETVLLRHYEILKGYIITENGIEVVIGQKPGRKVNREVETKEND